LGKAGLSEKEAADWQSRIDAGAVLLGVHARAVKVGDVESVFARHGVERVVGAKWDDR
jgi:hypothetical protein